MLRAVLFDWGDTLFHFAYDERLLSSGWDAGLTALERDGYSIHFHVFTEFEVMELFTVLRRRYALQFTIEQIANNRLHEMVVAARKD